MRYALIGPDNEWVSGPHGETPSPDDGQRVEVIALGFPETAAWSQSLNGFVDIEEPSTQLTKLAFQRRFTLAERIAVRGSNDPIVVDYRELSTLAEGIDLSDADVIAGINYLELIGLLNAGRAAEILAP